MSTLEQTLSTLLTHFLKQHPEFSAIFEKISSSSQGKINNDIIEEWSLREFSAPSPHSIKQIVLLRNSIPDAIWVETGTYMGYTTELLSKHSPMVYSIEPEKSLFLEAKTKFQDITNITLFNSTSEDTFPILLPNLNGNVNFWLDGHYSAGVTFKGQQDTPIIDELSFISKEMNHFDKICVLVDDVRCFNPKLIEYMTYPSLDFLVDWSRNNHLNWHIEHDIFVAKNY